MPFGHTHPPILLDDLGDLWKVPILFTSVNMFGISSSSTDAYNVEGNIVFRGEVCRRKTTCHSVTVSRGHGVTLSQGVLIFFKIILPKDGQSTQRV